MLGNTLHLVLARGAGLVQNDRMHNTSLQKRQYYPFCDQVRWVRGHTSSSSTHGSGFNDLAADAWQQHIHDMITTTTVAEEPTCLFHLYTVVGNETGYKHSYNRTDAVHSLSKRLPTRLEQTIPEAE